MISKHTGPRSGSCLPPRARTALATFGRTAAGPHRIGDR